jgi:hypothetical protein
MASPSDWGPPLWKILHALAEKLGNYSHRILVEDQRRAWVAFLKSIDYVLPCVKCQNHYRLWRKNNPVDIFLHLEGAALRKQSREWVWKLHTSVNGNKQIAENPPLEMMESMYSDIMISAEIEKCFASFKTAITLRTLTTDKYHQFKKALFTLRHFI